MAKYVSAFGVSVAALALAAGSAIFAFHRVMFPEPVITMQQPLQAPAEVWAGGVLPIEASYCKAEPYQATVGYYFISTDEPLKVVNLPSAITSLPTGCHSATFYIEVPAVTPEGLYKLYLSPIYRPSMVSHVQHTFVSTPFFVRKP